jgi:cell fate (sporulation/competence/biofilm development) regulator YlbF (YheA/YmcA/DUF963 family)
METNVKESGIVQRAQDLCEAIASQPDFSAMKGKLDAFMADEYVKFQYQQLNQLGSLLQMKQENGVELKQEEITQFEALREELLGNSVARGFLEAQEQLQQIHQVVGRFIDKTFELGRRPEFEDVHDGSCCGGGCHGG